MSLRTLDSREIGAVPRFKPAGGGGGGSDYLADTLASIAQYEVAIVGPDLAAQPGSMNDAQPPLTEAEWDYDGTGFTDDDEVELKVGAYLPRHPRGWSGMVVPHTTWAGWAYICGGGHEFDGWDGSGFMICLKTGRIWRRATTHCRYATTPDDYGVYVNTPTRYARRDVNGNPAPPADHSYNNYGYMEDGPNGPCIVQFQASITDQSSHQKIVWRLDLGTPPADPVAGSFSTAWVIAQTGWEWANINGSIGKLRIPGTNKFYWHNSNQHAGEYDLDTGTMVWPAFLNYTAGGGSMIPQGIIPNIDGISGAYDVVTPNADGTITIRPKVTHPYPGAGYQEAYDIASYVGDEPEWNENSGCAYRTGTRELYFLVDGDRMQKVVLSGTSAASVATVTTITLTGEVPAWMDLPSLPSGAGHADGITGKWQYCPDYDCILWFGNDPVANDGAVRAVKIAA